MPNEAEMPLADLIEAVRHELQAAADRAATEPLSFEVEDVELQVDVVASGSREAEGGIKLWVVNLGGKGTTSYSNTQTVTLRLSASGPDGTRWRVTDDQGRPVRRSSR